MNKYELALVISAKLEDEDRAAVLEKAKGYIERYGGSISNVEEWGKKRLAYEIQKMREGYYYFVHFEAEPTCPAELERHVRIMDHVLRYLIVRSDEEETAEESQEAPAQPVEQTETRTETPEAE